jgi:hypothetical protein
MKENGRIICSLPNIMHISVIMPLLKNGLFEYQDSGILDKTHLKFFTRNSIIRLAQNLELSIEEMDEKYTPISESQQGYLAKLSSVIGNDNLKDFEVLQYIFTLKK